MHQHPPCLMASVSKSERVRTLSSRTEYGSRFMTRRSYAERRNEACCLSAAHRLDPHVGEGEDEKQRGHHQVGWFPDRKVALECGQVPVQVSPEDPADRVTNRSQVAKAANPCEH